MKKINRIHKNLLHLFILSINCLAVQSIVAQQIPRGPAVTTYPFNANSKMAGDYAACKDGYKSDPNINPTIQYCEWNFFKVKELQPAAIPNSMICNKVFEASSMPAGTTRHLMGVKDIAFENSDSTKKLILNANNEVTAAPFRFYEMSVSSTYGMDPATTFMWRHGSPPTQLPFYEAGNYQPYTGAERLNYGRYKQRFVITRKYSTIEEINNETILTNPNYVGFKDDLLLSEKRCITNPTEFGKGTVASIVTLDELNQPIDGQSRVICLYNNIYSPNADNKMIAVDLNSLGSNIGQGANSMGTLYFWQETAQNLSQPQIDNIKDCLIDSDDDYIPNYLDPCPYNSPKELLKGGIGTGIHRIEAAKDYNYVLNNFELDSDGDGVGDLCDNCKDISNPDQLDGDGILGGKNCIFMTSNANLNCDIANYKDNVLCDIVTDVEKQAIEPQAFAANSVTLTLPAFNFDSNASRSNRTCKLGKVILGSKTIVDCASVDEQSDDFKFCNDLCNFSTEDNCFYKAKFNMLPSLLKAKAANVQTVQSYFDNPDVGINLDLEVNIDSDYKTSSIGNFNTNKTSSSYVTTKNTDASKHVCTFNVTLKKEIVNMNSANCKIMVNGSSYDNITTVDDYLKAISDSAKQCGL